MEIRNLNVTTLNGRPVLKDVSFFVNEGDKLAVIGEEGNGKTTLLNAIYDKSILQDGFVVSGDIIKKEKNVGYLRQTIDNDWGNYSALDYILCDTPGGEPNYDVYEKFGDILQIAYQLGLKDDVFDGNQTISTLSGGEKVKLQLVKVLSQKPDLLLLDEPTNDLDIDTLVLLEKIIKEYKDPIIFVSHDETLLERTANCVLHLEQLKRKTEPRATFSALSYRDYVETRLGQMQKQDQIARSEQAERKEQLKVTKDIKSKIQQANPGRTNSMRAVLAREARWERTEVTQYSESEDAISLRFAQDVSLPNSKVVLKLDMPELRNGQQVLAHNVKLDVIGPEKIVIIGKNGCGKSTLIKQIYDYYQTEQPSGLKVSYMPQNYGDFLDLNSDAISWLGEGKSKKDIELIMTILGRLKFTSEEMRHPMGSISNGQRAKIYLTKIMLDGSNVLLLDEPTRNLSPLSNPEIRKFFKSFGGAIISVSHDRKFIEQVCDKVYLLSEDGLQPETEPINQDEEDHL